MTKKCETQAFIPFRGGVASDVACCDWLRHPGNDVQLHLVVVIRYKSAERSHMQLQFHPDFQSKKVRNQLLSP